jgi:sec-independent protein translocase protein TatB
MFGLGMMELVVIAIVALLFVGPDKLPDAAKKISRGIRDFRQQTRELSKTIDDDTELGSAVRDLKSALRGDDFRPPPTRPAAKPAPPVVSDPEVAAAEGDAPAPAVEADGDQPNLDDEGAPLVKLASGAVAKGDDGQPGLDDDDGKAARGDEAHG